MPEDTNPQSDSGWEKYHTLVMADLARHSDSLDSLDTKLDKVHEAIIHKLDQIQITDIPSLRVDIKALQVKAVTTGGLVGGLSGLMGGLSPIIVALLYKIFSH